MPREFARSRRVGEQMHRVLSELLTLELKDPRLSSVTLTAVEVSRDLGHARVYFSLLHPDADPAPVRQALDGASGLLRRRLGRALVIRRVPELEFRHDESAARGDRLTELISEALASDQAKNRGPGGS